MDNIIPKDVPPDYTNELFHLSIIDRQFAHLIRSAINAYRDHKLDMTEGILLGQGGIMIAHQINALVKSLSEEGWERLLYVAEHSERVLTR